MSFTPVVPFGGYAGWKFLARTREAQKEAFLENATLQRDEAYFREKIGGIATAEDLVADRRLLSVALGAFGLGDDIDNRYFIRKVLEDGTLRPDALANKLADKRYQEFSKAFGFGDFDVPRTRLSDFADGILASYETRRFEEAVGEQSEAMRLGLNAERELARLADRNISGDAKWFSVLGSAPLREVFQTALGLPAAFASIDLDQQLGTLKNRAEQMLGSSDIAQFSDPRKVEDLVRLYLLRAEAQGARSVYSAQSAALTLLQSATTGGGLLSRLV
ncbi:MAG: flagellar protein [Rhodobacterales bacterium 32-67-9]|nr:MAG: flagellar protein [Rhodobacterales bacterium 32-67-9]